MAIIDVDCKAEVDYIQRLADLQAQLEQPVVDRHAQELDQVRREYDDLLASQKDSLSKSPADYGASAEDFQKNGGDPMLYTPEGYVRVRSISITPEGDVSADYTSLKDEMTQIEAEYGAAALAALADKYTASGKAGSHGSMVTFFMQFCQR